MSKRRLEGYLMMDHRNSPGLSDAHVMERELPAGAGKGLFETSVLFCSHCPAMIVVMTPTNHNPKRGKAAEYCPGCDRYLCERCHDERIRTGICKTWAQQIEEYVERVLQDTLIKEI